ncbi:MAG TPA: S8 family serine peptidase [Candidatus Angelobacter sp.]|nr:S8 family serine peptidase [Candidatus Angelobacter sp.]
MRKSLIRTILFFLASLPLAAQTSYILTASPSNMQNIVNNHGLTVVKELYDGTNCVMLVSSPSSSVSGVETDVDSDLTVVGFEPQQHPTLPELNGATQATLTQSTSGILDSLAGRTLVSFFGSTVPSNYTTQTATTIIRLADARTATNLTGSGVVAIIDTGADITHPALTGVLVPGFDFTRNVAGGSEMADLNPTIVAQLQQSTSGILDAQNTLIVNTSAVAILSQSTSGILDQSTSGILDSSLSEFGHGTMTAGIVHLVAPTAKIMPLKAFQANGSSNLSDIISAIYYAADHGANVISMSFSIAQPSPSLQAAVQYALSKNVILVASSGNDGLKTLVYPASYGGVEGIGSTTNTDIRSTFSNYGSGVVTFAAPGEGVITTYPAGNYAAGWGTSFSAPMVAGSAALVLQARPAAKPGDVVNALSKAKQISDMGYGRIDLYASLTNLLNSSGSTSTTSTSTTSTSSTTTTGSGGSGSGSTSGGSTTTTTP